MTDFSHIEKQIDHLFCEASITPEVDESNDLHHAATTMRQMLEVVRAAKSVLRWHEVVGSALTDLEDAVAKLEASDE